MSMYAWFPKENGNMPQAATHSDTNNVEEIPAMMVQGTNIILRSFKTN